MASKHFITSRTDDSGWYDAAQDFLSTNGCKDLEFVVDNSSNKTADDAFRVAAQQLKNYSGDEVLLGLPAPVVITARLEKDAATARCKCQCGSTLSCGGGGGGHLA